MAHHEAHDKVSDIWFQMCSNASKVWSLKDSMVITQIFLKGSRAVTTFTPNQMQKPARWGGLSMWWSVLRCDPDLWLLAARFQITFLLCVTTVSSHQLHPVTERSLVIRQPLLHSFYLSFTVGLNLIVSYRKMRTNGQQRHPNFSD